MVDRGYLLDKPAPPSPVMVFIDQKVIPVAIDAAGTAEVALNQMFVATRKRPFTGLGIALSLGYLAAVLLIPRRRHRYITS